MGGNRRRSTSRGTVLRLFLVMQLIFIAATIVVARERDEERAGPDVELHVLHDQRTPSSIPVLTTGGPPEPPIFWSRVSAERSAGDSWVLRVRIAPVDPGRLVTVRIVGDVDADGVPISEPVSFTCADESAVQPAGWSCVSGGEGYYTAVWPRSLGSRVAVSSDLTVGSEIWYTTWAMQLTDPDGVAP